MRSYLVSYVEDTTSWDPHGLTFAMAGQWWMGAALLVAGSVIIGRREETKTVPSVDSKVEEDKSAINTKNIISEPKSNPSAYELRKRG